MKREENRQKADTKDSASLVEALQALAAEMSRACTDTEAEAGLKKLRQIRVDFLGKDSSSGAVNAARRDAEALIAWLEARLEQLRQQLARRRRMQESAGLEQTFKQREAEGPSLLPTELIDAVVRSTQAKDPEKLTSSAPEAEPPKPKDGPGEKKAPPEKEKETETKPEPDKKPAPEQKPEPERKREAEQKVEAAKEAAPEAPKEEVPADRTEQKREPLAVQRQEAFAVPAARKPEWTKFERLAAHMAASAGEDPKFFEKLRKAAKRPGPAQKAPADDKAAEAHYRSVHDLGKRLVNLELHAKAIAKAREKQEPISHLLKTAARELKSFLREFKAAKEERPEMAEDYERRFGGYAEQFAAMKPEKGGALLEQCRAERQGKKPAPEKEPEREADAPQLVLKRDDYWQQ